MLRLRCITDTTIPIEAECLTPDFLAGKSNDEIANLPVFHGNREEKLGEFFAIEGDCNDGDLVLEGDCSRVKLVGAGMATGRLTIDGDVGMHLGAEMTGGEIRVHGNAGDWVGAEMRGGRIHVHGNAGHLVGGAYRGSRRGMRGGVLLIDGNAGNEIGGVMRRGLIAIGGNTGDFTGVSMIAGSVFVFGRPGIRTGAGMKRGSIVAFAEELPLLPTFRYDCEYFPTFVRIYLHQLIDWGFAQAEPHLGACFRRFSGDIVSLGQGEILHRSPDA
ncbi:MAG: formylmethanofuran dehydrogenase subunit C [Gemmataceae bacterium]